MRRGVSIRGLLADESGATAIEYGLIVGLIAVVLLGSLAATGGAVGAIWNRLAAIAAALVSGGG